MAVKKPWSDSLIDTEDLLEVSFPSPMPSHQESSCARNREESACSSRFFLWTILKYVGRLPTAGAEMESRSFSWLHYKIAAGSRQILFNQNSCRWGPCCCCCKCWRLNLGPLVHAKWALESFKKHRPMIDRSLRLFTTVGMRAMRPAPHFKSWNASRGHPTSVKNISPAF